MIDDATLGYSARDVLAVINQSAVGDLIWFDGTQTKVRFSAQFARDQPVSVVNPPPNAGFCYRAMNFNIFASITTDDGRLNEALDGSVDVTDQGSRFVVDDVSVSLNAISGPQLSATSIAKAASALAPAGTSVSMDVLTLSLVIKGATCSEFCASGQAPSGLADDDCFPPSGRIVGQLSYDGQNVCASFALLATWRWE